jgi:hypothetical protein
MMSRSGSTSSSLLPARSAAAAQSVAGMPVPQVALSPCAGRISFLPEGGWAEGPPEVHAGHPGVPRVPLRHRDKALDPHILGVLTGVPQAWQGSL